MTALNTNFIDIDKVYANFIVIHKVYDKHT